MALSEPERGAYDPKAHLVQPSMGGMDLDETTYEAPIQHSLKTHLSDTAASINTSAHQINGAPAERDFAPAATNGIHDTHGSATDTQSSFDYNSSLPASAETTLTRDSIQISSSQTTPDEASLLITSMLDPAPPIMQQPTSDVRAEPQQQGSAMASTQEMDTSEAAPAEASDTYVESVKGVNVPSALAPTSARTPPVDVADPPPSEILLPDAPQEGQEAPSALVNEDTMLVSATLDGAAEMDISKISVATAEVPPPISPLEPAPTPVMPETNPTDSTEKATPATDRNMQDPPVSPPKVGRPREEDEGADAPAAKRTKTDAESSEAASHDELSLLTRPQQKYLQRAIGNVKRIAAAKNFLLPVDFVALQIPSYPQVITNPMDLKTVEDNLRADKYLTVEACVADFNQIVHNSLTFNGPEHPVTKSAQAMKASFDKHMELLPSADIKDPPPLKKKAPDPVAIRAPPARRESRTSLPGSAGLPSSAVSTKFALGPDQMPTIRRDSTIDGRPKREIHRPPPRDLPYNHQKPKKKKYQLELKFCDHVMKEITKPKWSTLWFPFIAPVDPIALNIPQYHKIIRRPMDFGTIRTKLERGEYENAKEFEGDARQVFTNCYAFNLPGDATYVTGKKYEGVFNEEWDRKGDWLEENAPHSGQRSPTSSDDEESEEEEEEEVENDEQMSVVAKLQKQIAEMSKQVELITSKKNKTPPIANKKAVKKEKGLKKETKKAVVPPPKVEKKAAPKPVKKEKIPYVTYEQKEDISRRINSLSDLRMTQALNIIRQNEPSLKDIQDEELELDIDELSNPTLYKLLHFVRKHVPEREDSPVRPAVTASTAAPARKKNKPMSKHEQEARIAQVQSGLSAFQKGQSSGSYPEVQQSIEMNASDDDDDEEDSESEEE